MGSKANDKGYYIGELQVDLEDGRSRIFIRHVKKLEDKDLETAIKELYPGVRSLCFYVSRPEGNVDQDEMTTSLKLKAAKVLAMLLNKAVGAETWCVVKDGDSKSGI